MYGSLKKLQKLYFSPNIIRMIESNRIRCVGHVARTAYERNPYRVLLGKRPLGRPKRRWKGNIKMGLGEIVWGGMDWVHMTQYRVQRRTFVNMVTNHDFHKILCNC
jgi:hypothetical protein